MNILKIWKSVKSDLSSTKLRNKMIESRKDIINNYLTRESNKISDGHKPLRMYVLVQREVLPLVHAGVQAGHAVHTYVWEHRDKPETKQWCEEDKTMLYLSATWEQMHDMITYFTIKNMGFSRFHEPDMGDELTAVAFQPMSKEEGNILFGRFKLLE
jgi:hypothetical protein